MYIYMRVPKTQPGESQILLTVTKYSSADPSVRLCEKNADTTDCLQGEDTIDVSLVDAVDGQSEVSHVTHKCFLFRVIQVLLFCFTSPFLR